MAVSPNIYVRGVDRSVVIAPETAYGQAAAGPGQLLRRTSFTMDNQPPEIASTEITEDAQPLDSRLGVQTLPANLSGQLSPATYKMLFEALLRGTWTAGIATPAMADTTFTVNGSTAAGTLTSAGASNYLSLGFKAGDVINFSGLLAPAAGMNGINLRITAVTANTVAIAPNPALIAWTTGQANVIMTVAGKKLIIPRHALQVYRSFSIEAWDPAISRSQLGVGLRPTQIALGISPNGWVTFQCTLAGQTDIMSSAQVFVTPVDQTTTQGVTGTSGKISYQGLDLGYITGFNLQIQAAAQPVPAIGNNVTPDILMGTFTTRGTMTCLFTQDNFNTDFRNENEVQIALYLPSSPAPNAPFVSVYLPRARLWSDNRTDSDRAIMRSLNFSALQQINGGAGTQYDYTMLGMQDSQA